MSFWRQGLANAGFLSLQAVLVRGGGLIANLILARLLTPSAWGLFNAIVSANQTLYQLTKFSFDSALHVRFSERGQETEGLGPADFAGAGLIAMGALALFAFVAVILFARPVAILFGAPELAPWMAVAGIGAATQFAMGYGAAALFGAGDFRGTTLINGCAMALYLGLLLVALLTGLWELWVVIAAFVAFQLLGAVWMMVRGLNALRRRGASPVFSRALPAMADLLRFGLPLYLSSFFPSLAIFFLMGELSRLHGIAALSDLRVAVTISQLVLFLPAAVSQAFITQFARVRSEAEFPAQEFARYLKLVTVATILTMLSVAGLVPGATPILFGAAYAPAVGPVLIALLVAGIQAVKQAILVGFISERRTVYPLIDSVISTVALVPLGFWLVPGMGAAGLLIAQAASQAAAAIVMLGLAAWRARHDPSARDIAVSGLALFLGAGATALGLETAASPYHLVLFTALVLVAGLASLYGLGRRNERERLFAVLKEVLSPAPKGSRGPAG